MDDSSLYTGSGDGMIRAVHILPNNLVGMIGDNGEMPIESMCKSFDDQWLATCSHDNTIKVWSADVNRLDCQVFDQASDDENNKRPLSDSDMDSDQESDSDSEKEATYKPGKTRKQFKTASLAKEASFFAELD